MPLQDLTPQLRTRLNRMERAVGLFVTIATVLLLLGLGYYVYKTAQNKGWFAIHARYFTYAKSGAGIHIGDRVRLMGFDVGQITDIQPMQPHWDGSQDNVYIEFEVIGKNYGYIWTGAGGSTVRFVDNLIGNSRQLDITSGTNGYSAYILYKVRDLTLEEIKESPHLNDLRLGQEIYDGSNLVLKAWASVSTNLDKLQSLGSNSFWVIDRSRTNSSLKSIWNSDARHYEPVTEKSK